MIVAVSILGYKQQFKLRRLLIDNLTVNDWIKQLYTFMMEQNWRQV